HSTSVPLTTTRSARPSARASGGSAWTVTSRSSEWKPGLVSPVVKTAAAIGGPPNHAPTTTNSAARTRTPKQPRTVSSPRSPSPRATPPPPAARRAGDARGGLTSVVLDGRGGAEDRGFVPVAREQHAVAGTRRLGRRRDRRRPVGDEQ